MEKYYLPIITPQKNEVIEITKEQSEKMLDTLYKHINTDCVDRLTINDNYDLIVDDNGMAKAPNYALKFPKYPKLYNHFLQKEEDFSDNMFFGTLIFVKNVKDENGELSWAAFKGRNGKKELTQILEKYFSEKIVLTKEINPQNN
tara:strand:+ start:535 stop:969 length:435 start_codon:yes stop_codon:yes gene_type:complete